MPSYKKPSALMQLEAGGFSRRGGRKHFKNQILLFGQPGLNQPLTAYVHVFIMLPVSRNGYGEWLFHDQGSGGIFESPSEISVLDS